MKIEPRIKLNYNITNKVLEIILILTCVVTKNNYDT